MEIWMEGRQKGHKPIAAGHPFLQMIRNKNLRQNVHVRCIGATLSKRSVDRVIVYFRSIYIYSIIIV